MSASTEPGPPMPPTATPPLTPSPDAVSRPAAGRPRAQLHERVFAATLAEVAAAGYAGATMDRIASSAGVAKTTMYRRWPSKAALVCDCMSEAFGDVGITGDSPAARIESGVRWLAGKLRIPGLAAAFAGVFAEAIVDPAARALLAENFQEPYVGPLSEAVGLPEARLLLLIDVVAGSLLHRMGITGRPMSDDDIEVFVEMLTRTFGT